MTYVKLNYLNQDVEVGSDKECKILDDHNPQRVTKNIQFDSFERHKIFGAELKVMAKAQLVAYKRQLNRKVDVDDIEQMNENL